ncbi:MAG: twin transmembrane helix small protein [Alphaproteobacteria bacterium]|nr:twin transmembrane helix small protein [Alphaproteobacteria bacterium]
MSRIFFILMIISMALVLASLVIGLFAMIKGGEFNKKYGNKLMRARVTLQGVALGLFVLAVWARNSGE